MQAFKETFIQPASASRNYQTDSWMMRAQRGVCFQQERQIFARLDRADIENETRRQTVALLDFGERLRIFLRLEAGFHAFRDDVDFGRIKPIKAQRVAPGVLRDGDDGIRAGEET